MASLLQLSDPGASNLEFFTNPALLLLFGALVLPLLPVRLRGLWLPIPPLAGTVLLWSLPNGATGTYDYLGAALEPFRLDPLSRGFGTAFLLAALLGAIYAIWLRDLVHQVAILVYAGATVGATFAGDLVTLFVWWELAGLASTVLIWARGLIQPADSSRAARAGQRYLLVQVISGVLLLGGMAVWVSAGNGLAFDAIGVGGVGDVGGWLILFAFGLKAGFPLLYVWITDTYPEATVVGTVILSAFTTKLAIYALIRGFAGTEPLFWFGPVTAVLALFFALLQRDLRRVLAYALVVQLGYLLTAVGAGGEVGVNGATAHSLVHIAYNMLLFMTLGAVLYRTGTVRSDQLGGLLRTMPVAAVGFAVGAATMAAAPLFAGFVSKGLLMEAVKEHHEAVYWLLLVVSILVFTHFCLRVFQLVFLGRPARFGSEAVDRTEPEAPWSMRLAIALAVVVCVALGLLPGLLGGILPYPVELAVYSPSHVLEQLVLLAAGAALFGALVWTRRYPTVRRTYRVDADILYLRVLPRAAAAGVRGCAGVRDLAVRAVRGPGARLLDSVLNPVRIQGRIAAPWTTGAMTAWTVLVFGVALVAALALS